MHAASAVKDLCGNIKFPAFVQYKKEKKKIKYVTFTVSAQVLKEHLESLE